MKRVLISTSLGFVAGILVAGCVAVFYMRWRLGWSESLHAAASAGSYVAALYPLQAGDTNTAVSRLETLLDGEILVLGTVPQTEIVTGALDQVKLYRSKHPYNSGDKGIAATTQHILSGVPTK